MVTPVWKTGSLEVLSINTQHRKTSRTPDTIGSCTHKRVQVLVRHQKESSVNLNRLGITQA